MPFLVPELVDQILLEVVPLRGFQRSLRLKLVCKLFSQAVDRAIFETHLLDSHYPLHTLTDWQINKDRRASNYWHSYLVYRVQDDSESCPPRFRNIRRIAEAICRETGGDLKITIEALCWPALGRVAGSKNFDYTLNHNWVNDCCFNGDLAAAVAYLNVGPMIPHFLRPSNLRSPFRTSRFFGSAIQLAACAGNTQTLNGFQQEMYMRGAELPMATRDDSFSIIGAAMSGDLDMVKLAINTPPQTGLERANFLNQELGTIQRHLEYGLILEKAQEFTGNIEVYTYLDSFFRDSKVKNKDVSAKYFRQAMGIEALMTHVRVGNIEIVRFILDQGANISGLDGKNLVAMACRNNHGDIVDLLLERGAEPNFNGLNQKRLDWLGKNLISIGAEARKLPIVRKLLGRGANLCHVQTGDRALEWAVSREDKTMVKTLIDFGVDFASWGGILLRSTKSLGLESMAELLQEEYFRLSVLQRARWMMVLDGTINPAHRKGWVPRRKNGKKEAHIEWRSVKFSAKP